MFQDVDSRQTGTSLPRREWMALLARAPVELLYPVIEMPEPPRYSWLRQPQTGLMMVEGRIGGSGGRFNLGEVTMTRCALKYFRANAAAEPLVGVSYILGRSHRHAKLAAMADALLQDENFAQHLEETLLAPIRRHLDERTQQEQKKSQGTKVEFFTVAREAGKPTPTTRAAS